MLLPELEIVEMTFHCRRIFFTRDMAGKAALRPSLASLEALVCSTAQSVLVALLFFLLLFTDDLIIAR